MNTSAYYKRSNDCLHLFKLIVINSFLKLTGAISTDALLVYQFLPISMALGTASSVVKWIRQLLQCWKHHESCLYDAIFVLKLESPNDFKRPSVRISATSCVVKLKIFYVQSVIMATFNRLFVHQSIVFILTFWAYVSLHTSRQAYSK